MFCLWRFSSVQGYLYTAAGVSTCIVVGYLASLWAGSNKPLTGLTIHTLHQPGSETDDSETSARDSHPH